MSDHLHDPRVSAFGGDGYTVRAAGTDYQVLHTDAFGWGVYTGDNLDIVITEQGGMAIGYPDAADAVGDLLRADDIHHDREYLLDAADRCERAAATLQADGDDPAGSLTSRGWSTQGQDLDAYAERKHAAAQAARDYAQQLRDRAGMRQPLTDDQRRQADLVTGAAELGGLLIDSAYHDADPNRRQAVEDSGLFTRVADPGQVPYFTLTGRADTNADIAADATAEADTPAPPDADSDEDTF
jgi:hypothetical protein